MPRAKDLYLTTGEGQHQAVAFDIECGGIVGTVTALSIGSAWRKITSGRVDGFAKLARWRERTSGGGRTVWKYQTPESLDKAD